MQAHEYVVMLTQRCNYRCTYCYQTHTSIDQELKVIQRIAALVQQQGHPETRVIFHGGEPLLRKDLVQAGVKLLLDEDGEPVCRFSIVTNGALIDDETLELFRRYHFTVNVSFDGCREAQAFRDAASFDQVVENLQRLVALHESGDVELTVTSTVTLQNLPYLSRSVAFLTDLGIPAIGIEGDLYGPWIEGTEHEVDRQVEQVVQLMERRVEQGLSVPVARLDPQPYHPAGKWWETDAQREAVRERRLAGSECNCGSGNASVIYPDGSSWACPLYIPDLGKVSPRRLAEPEAFHYGSWSTSDDPSPEAIKAKGQRIRNEPVMGTKRERYSIFAECASCPHVTDCTVCPGASHLPDAQKPAEEVPPLLCRLNMAFLSRRNRIRRPVTLADLLESAARASSAT